MRRSWTIGRSWPIHRPGMIDTDCMINADCMINGRIGGTATRHGADSRRSWAVAPGRAGELRLAGLGSCARRGGSVLGDGGADVGPEVDPAGERLAGADPALGLVARGRHIGGGLRGV